MEILKKDSLVDGQYYEGRSLESGAVRVAKWSAQDQVFMYVIYRWTEPYVCPMTYFEEFSDYFEGFKPLFIVDPMEDQRIEKHL